MPPEAAATPGGNTATESRNPKAHTTHLWSHLSIVPELVRRWSRGGLHVGRSPAQCRAASDAAMRVIVFPCILLYFWRGTVEGWRPGCDVELWPAPQRSQKIAEGRN